MAEQGDAYTPTELVKQLHGNLKSLCIDPHALPKETQTHLPLVLLSNRRVCARVGALGVDCWERWQHGL
jgi:hypothetical protein